MEYSLVHSDGLLLSRLDHGKPTNLLDFAFQSKDKNALNFYTANEIRVCQTYPTGGKP